MRSGALLARSSEQRDLRLGNLWIVLRRWAPLSAILAVAALVRLTSLSLMEFRHDSAYWALAAQRAITGGTLPLVGQQVGSVDVELYNGPLLTYVSMLVFALFDPRPEYMAALIAACNVVGVLLTFKLGTRLYSNSVGLMAAALMAVAPWLVLYGRMYWPQALFPFLIPLALLTLFAALERERWTLYTAYGLLLGVGLQLHLSVMALIGASVLIVLLYGRRRVMVAALAVGVAVGYAPVIAYDLTHGFTNTSALIRLPLLHASDESRITHLAKAAWNFSNVLSGQGLWVSKVGTSPYLPRGFDWAQGLIFCVLLLAALVLIALTRQPQVSMRRLLRMPAPDGVLLIFVGLPALYLFFSRSEIARHYFIFLYPAPFLLIARGVSLWRARFAGRPVFSALMPLVLAAGLLLNIATIVYAYRFIDRRGGEAEYGVALTDKRAAVDFIVTGSNGAVIVDVTGVQESLPYVFLFEASGNVITVEGSENDAATLHVGSAGMPAQRFQILETSYHPLPEQLTDAVVFESRGVIVIQEE